MLCNIEVVRERKTLKKLEREFRESTSQNESDSGRERFVNIQLSANSKRALEEHIPHDMFNISRESPTGLSRSLIQVPNVYIDCAESLTHSEERIFMTTKHGSKKRIRNYADEHAMNYTNAQSIVDGADNAVEILREHVEKHSKIDAFAVQSMSQSEIEHVASYIPLLDKLDDERWTLSVGQSATVLALMEDGEQIVIAGAFQNGFPQTEDVFELNTSLNTMDGCNVIVMRSNEALQSIADKTEENVRVAEIGGVVTIDVANVRASSVEWSDMLAAVLNEIAVSV